MGVRFNKRVTILPWLRANVGKSGISLSIGPKGKTLNIGSTGVSVNVSLGKGMGYSKRLLSWKKLNLLSILGLGGAATKSSKAAKKGKKETAPTGDITLDDAIAEAEKAQQENEATDSTSQDQAGCSWGCAFLGCLGMLVIIALLVVIVVLLVRSGSIDLSNL